MARRREAQVSPPESRTDRQLVGRMLEASNLGFMGRKMTFDNFERTKANTAAYDVAVKWCEDFAGRGTKGLLFYGATGVGKTHLACAIVNRMIRERHVFCYVQPMTTMPKEDSDEIRRLTRWSEIPVLVLDDLGSEKLTERALECLYSVVDGRGWNGAPLIATTNFTEEGLRDLLNKAEAGRGDKVIGRLRSACEWVCVKGRDRRLDK